MPFGTRMTVFFLLLMSSAIMSLAWLGHLSFEDELNFGQAMMFSWILVLPEYALNILAFRIGYGKLTGGQMAAYNLSSGVVCVALVSRFVLGESFTGQRIAGFVLMVLAMFLISAKTTNEIAEDSAIKGDQ